MSSQRGISLIELMVALTIALFLLLGVGVMFISMRHTFIDRQALSALQNNERIAMTILAASIQGAGYYPSSIPPASPATPPAWSVGQPLSGTAGGTSPDTLSTSFISPATGSTNNQGCSAAPVANTAYTDVFSIGAATSTYPNTLICTEQYGTVTTVIPLITGVTGMSVLYGIDPAGLGLSEYVDASGVTNWATVKSVGITLVFSNPLASEPGQPATVSVTRVATYMNRL